MAGDDEGLGGGGQVKDFLGYERGKIGRAHV